MQSLPWHKRMMIKYRRLIGMAIPALFFHFFWLAYFIKFDLWHMFSTDSNYRISIMAIFGSLIAGKSKRADLIINQQHDNQNIKKKHASTKFNGCGIAWKRLLTCVVSIEDYSNQGYPCSNLHYRRSHCPYKGIQLITLRSITVKKLYELSLYISAYQNKSYSFQRIFPEGLIVPPI